MDSRISTAPTLKDKKWVSTNTSASCLLRQPSNKSGRDFRLDVSSVVDRPLTCPTPVLTPQFHWNLNNSALKTLTRNQIEQLYGLFKFYDSSAIGDNLPSINCPRLVGILRDAQLLNDSTNSTSKKRLQVEAIDKIFAQAAMGKLRVYLDADGQPALTFPLFCGALMNCAMLLTPLAHPEAALRQILPILLEGPILKGHHVSTTPALLSHLPTEGSISLWIPGRSHCQSQPENGQHDFRELPPFQQVIADCSRDKVLDELKQEKLARRYQIPDHLIATFHRDTILLISNKFRMFDVFDRGAVSRQEVFPLLSSLGKHADLPDPYAVVTTLSTSTANTDNSGEVNGGEITLAQLLQAIETTRKSKRFSINAQFAAMKINIARVIPVVPAARGETTSVTKTESMSSLQEAEPDHRSNTDHPVSPHKTLSHRHGPSTSKERGKKNGISRLRSRQSILSQGSGVGSSTHSLLNGKHEKVTLVHHASVSGKKKSELHRKVKNPAESGGLRGHRHSGVASSKNHTQRSGTTICSNSINSDDGSSRSSDLSSECVSQRSASIRRVTNSSHETQSHLSDIMTIQVREPSSAANKKMLQVFLLLGGDHDGAICCTISLVFATREITESEGIYYSTSPSDTTRTTPVRPTQQTLVNALLMLKKSVLSKQEQGFELRPTTQLHAIDEMMQALKRKQLRFSLVKSPAAKTLRGTVTAVASGIDVGLKAFPAPHHESRPTNQNIVVTELTASASSPSLVQTAAIPSARAGQVCIPYILPQRSRKAPPHSKPVHHQVNLPSNYRELFAVWEMAPNDTWVHDVNAASPARTQSKSLHFNHRSPLYLPCGQEKN